MSNKPRRTLQIGAVPFLNGKPLVRYLNTTGTPPIDLKLEVPSLLTPMMQRAQLDVALLPSIEYFRGDNYRIVPDIAITSDGTVESVRIFSKVPIETIRSLALDQSSRTSVTLARILLKHRFKLSPQFTQCTPDSSLEDLDVDAMLLIGDAAMTFRPDSSVHILDLGEEWKKHTSLPFVYAMWVTRGDIETGSLHERLLRAREKGLANLDEISAEAASELGLPKDVCLNYLENRIRYRLGEREVEALQLFQRLAVEDGLCRETIEIAFTD